MNREDIRQALSHLPVAELHYYESIGSTNDIARELLLGGSEHFTVVVADEQTTGRGRGNSPWYTPPNSALAISIILNPKALNDQLKPDFLLASLNTLGAVACATVFRSKWQLKAEVKLPNDVLINNRKVAGILAESVWHGNTLSGVIIGIGVNVRAESVPPAEKIDFPATSIADNLSLKEREKLDRLDLLKEIITSIHALLPKISSPDYIDLLNKYLWEKDKLLEGTVSGEVVGINQEYQLIVRDDNGVDHLLSSGSKPVLL